MLRHKRRIVPRWSEALSDKMELYGDANLCTLKATLKYACLNFGVNRSTVEHVIEYFK